MSEKRQAGQEFAEILLRNALEGGESREEKLNRLDVLAESALSILAHVMINSKDARKQRDKIMQNLEDVYCDLKLEGEIEEIKME